VPRLGIVGTMVWDRIHARDGREVPIEEWGGITYALAAAAAARPDGWTVVPIIRVGQDLQEQAYRFLRTLPGFDLDSGIRVVPESNNRVELRYRDAERRFERMAGGVSPWTADELIPCIDSLDALYINFISGFELGLETAIRLRGAFRGPIYADLHSLFLGIDPSGLRIPRPLEAWREWLACFDIVQVNEEELGILSQPWGDPWRFAADVVGPELRMLVVTLGERGAAYIASAEFGDGPLSWRRPVIRHEPIRRPGSAISEKFPAPWGEESGDPTGCGDVWGATCFSRLLAGQPLERAARDALNAAARNVRHRGATGLYEHLTGRIAS
jgi:sugar/nucleoside kinase (ribokinase family)